MLKATIELAVLGVPLECMGSNVPCRLPFLPLRSSRNYSSNKACGREAPTSGQYITRNVSIPSQTPSYPQSPHLLGLHSSSSTSSRSRIATTSLRKLSSGQVPKLSINNEIKTLPLPSPPLFLNPNYQGTSSR